MSDADRLRISYVSEGTYGTHPGGALKDMRITGESLVYESDFVSSQELRSDRQVADVIRTAARASGGLNAEMSYGAHDDLMQAGLLSAAWSAAVTYTAATISAASADNSINDSANGFVGAGFLVNQWVRISGFTGSTQNNGYAKITSVAAGKIILSGLDLVDDAAGESVTVVMGSQIVNGTTFTSFTIEKQFTDLTNEFEIFNGMAMSQLNWNITQAQIMTLSMQWLGKIGASATATGGSAYSAAPTAAVMAAVSDIQKVMESQALAVPLPGSIEITSLGIQLTNNLRTRGIVGLLTPKSLGRGKVAVSGTVQQYYETATIYNKYAAGTNTSLAAIMLDAAGNAYAIDMPRVRLTASRRVAGGENTDIMAEHGFTAYRHPTEGITLRIARFPA